MRFQIFIAVFFVSLFAFTKHSPVPIMVSHSEIKGPLADQVHTEDLKIFPDGRASYKEQGNDRKTGFFIVRLTARELRQLTKLLDSKEIRTLPAVIPSQIRTIDYNWENKMQLDRNGSQQTVVIHNFYPLLNTQRPAYSKTLIELECMLQSIQRRAAKRPAPTGEEDWCADALGKTK